MRLSLAALLAAVVASASACAGDPQTYSADEATTAFALHGFVLVDPSASQFPGVPEGVVIPDAYLVPKSGPNFVVVVANDAEADQAWSDYERLQDADSFDARRANVVVVSDDGPPAREQKRIVAALAALPDRGSPVEIAGD